MYDEMNLYKMLVCSKIEEKEHVDDSSIYGSTVMCNPNVLFNSSSSLEIVLTTQQKIYIYNPKGSFLPLFCNASALLTVSDEEFWEGVSPVEFGDLPALQDAVTVVGYPIGGDTISVTSGVVSRIEILSYVHGSTELLGLQVIEF